MYHTVSSYWILYLGGIFEIYRGGGMLVGFFCLCFVIALLCVHLLVNFCSL